MTAPTLKDKKEALSKFLETRTNDITYKQHKQHKEIIEVNSHEAQALGRFYQFYPDAVAQFEAETCRYCRVVLIDLDAYRKKQIALPDYLSECKQCYYVSVSFNRHYRVCLIGAAQ